MKIKETIVSITKKGAFHILIGSFVTRFVSLFASVFVVRILSKTDYGILSYYDNLYNYFFLLAGYGLMNSVLRYVVIANSIEEKKSVFDYCKKIGTLFNLGIIIIGIVFALYYKITNEQKYLEVVKSILNTSEYYTNF